VEELNPGGWIAVTLGEAEARRFTEIATFYGALGGRPKGATDPQLGATEFVAVTEFIFEAMPPALAREGYTGRPIKSIIEEHLLIGGLTPPISGDLLSALKCVIEQFQRTAPSLGRQGLKKKGVADLRASRRLYSAIRERQNARCATCGVPLATGDVEEQLDHVIPFRLIGDIADGSNWQLLCSRCNQGKGEYLSPALRASWHNWCYRLDYPPTSYADLPGEVRYATLWAKRVCSVCGRGALDTHLTVYPRSTQDSWVRTSLAVICLQDRPV
jgi:5-methylcytosine-specific restriction endonuclease McrA